MNNLRKSKSLPDAKSSGNLSTDHIFEWKSTHDKGLKLLCVY